MRALAVLALSGCAAVLVHSAPRPSLALTDVAAAAGLSTFHQSGGGTAEKRYIPEVMSGGVCAADFDGDGWTDLLLVNGGSFAAAAGQESAPAHGVFRNMHGRFTRLDDDAGIRNAGWGMGCATADVDNDGDLDLLITNFLAPLQLWRNDGGWRFTDVAAAAGIRGEPGAWYTGASFGDYDNDGRLDLAVAGYVRLDPGRLPDPATTPDCRHRGLVVNCGPRGLPGERDLLFHNAGGGRFDRVAGIDSERYYGLGAAFLPLDDDGGVALYVADDSTPNQLYRFSGGRAAEVATEAGVALSEEGHEQAGMGIAWGDANGDGRLDLYVTNFVDDYNTLYESLGGGLFEDVTRRARLAQPTWLFMGWGTAFVDFDNDGGEELIVANGHVYPQVDTLGIASTWRMPVQVFARGSGVPFDELPRTSIAGPAAVGRGLAIGDFWNDGTLGAVVNNLDGRPSLYRRAAADAGGWIELLLEGAAVRDATGARVTCAWDGGRAVRAVVSGGSYLSSHDRRVHVGVGTARAVRCDVRWPGGRRQDLGALVPGRVYRVREGTSAVR